MKSACAKFYLIALLCTSNVFANDGDDEQELKLTSPFYRPYEGDWVVRTLFSQNSQSYAIDRQSPVGSKTTNKNDDHSQLSLAYGMTDTLVIGVSAKYMFQQQYNETNTGSFASKPDTSSTNSGFYDPTFNLIACLLGKMRDEWALLLQFAFTPGIQDSNNFLFSYPNNQYLTSLLFGRNFGDFNFGVSLADQYYQNSSADTNNVKNDQQIVATGFVAQYDITDFYLRATGGFSEYVDQRSLNDPTRQQVTPSASGEIGYLCSDDFLISANISWTSAVTGSSSFISGGTSRPENIILGPTVVSTFSMALKF